MKKVTITLLIITLLFSVGICAIFVHRQKNQTAIQLDDLAVQQSDRYSSIHINSDGKLNINSATAEELSVLTGIGEVLAGRIIQYRVDSGPYKTIEELLLVKGIGEVTLNNIQNYIYAG